MTKRGENNKVCATELNIFDIQRFSWVDGPGIRTVLFFKGCNLDCIWCHNPESRSFDRDLLFYADRCIGCGKCVDICPNGCHAFSEGRHVVRRERCAGCGKCASVCNAEALEIVGKAAGVDDIMEEVLEDMEFYGMSGGGLTLSGGEPLLQPEGCFEILERCKKRGIHTAVDTAGYVEWSSFERVLPVTDYILYDVKTLDDEVHKKVCGVSNRAIIRNLLNLKDRDVNLIVRIPLVPGVNDTREDVLEIVGLVGGFDNLVKVELLPFHKLGRSKYEALGLAYRAEKIPVPDREKVCALRQHAAGKR
ncbi:MAG: glycyl-radical enzyme activating protein [Spirochaetes bacterium]|nr:glycyl-radical enzyme activating protein [Spirochaetota bacterium]